jgi:hypothetical protein
MENDEKAAGALDRIKIKKNLEQASLAMPAGRSANR